MGVFIHDKTISFETIDRAHVYASEVTAVEAKNFDDSDHTTTASYVVYYTSLSGAQAGPVYVDVDTFVDLKHIVRLSAGEARDAITLRQLNRAAEMHE